MPIFSSSIIQNIKDTKYTQSRVPFYPDDEFKYSRGLPSLDAYGIQWTGFFRGSGSGSYTPFSNFNIDSFGMYVIDITTTALNDYKTNGTPCYGGIYGAKSPSTNIYFKLDQITNFRFYIGFIDDIDGSDTVNDNDDCLINHNGLGLRVGLNDNFKIISNNGSASSNISSSIATIDTNIHNIYLESDALNSRWGYSMDNTDITYITSPIPDPTLSMTLCWSIVNKEAGVVKSWRCYDILGMQKTR